MASGFIVQTKVKYFNKFLEVFGWGADLLSARTLSVFTNVMWLNDTLEFEIIKSYICLVDIVQKWWKHLWSVVEFSLNIFGIIFLFLTQIHINCWLQCINNFQTFLGEEWYCLEIYNGQAIAFSSWKIKYMVTKV